jgi:hypothetical protein
MTGLKTLHVSPISGTLIPAGTPAGSAICWFQVGRDPTDTIAASVILEGVRIYYPVN